MCVIAASAGSTDSQATITCVSSIIPIIQKSALHAIQNIVNSNSSPSDAMLCAKVMNVDCNRKAIKVDLIQFQCAF